jgi:hypothetical protein
LSRIKRALAEHLLQAGPPFRGLWVAVRQKVPLLGGLRLHEQQAVRDLLSEDPRFILDTANDLGLMNTPVGLSCDPTAWPGKPDLLQSPDQLQRACQHAFEDTPQEDLLLSVSKLILDTAPITLSMRWAEVMQTLQRRQVQVDAQAYNVLSSSHPAFKYSFNDAGGATIRLVPALIKRQLQVRGANRSSPEPEQQQQQPHQALQGQSDEQELQAAELAAEPAAQPAQEQQQHEEQLQQQVPSPDPELMAAVAAAFSYQFPGQWMREAAELVVTYAPQKLALSETHLLQLCREHKVGLNRASSIYERTDWRRAIRQHPAWLLEGPDYAGADRTWSLVKEQLLRLAADRPAAVAALINFNLAAHKFFCLDHTEIDCLNKFSDKAAEHLAAIGAGSSEEIEHLMSAIFKQDPDLRASCLKQGRQLGQTPEALCLGWLREDGRFEIAAGDRSEWTSRTVVRLDSTGPGVRDQHRGSTPPQQEELQAAQPAAQPSAEPAQQQQHQQQAHAPPPGSELMASVVTAFPGDSLAAQVMREAAELVVGKAPQKLALSETYLLQLCKEHRVGWERVETVWERANWRQAIRQHPAWLLEDPQYLGADHTWVLVEEQVLSLAADPSGAEAAVAKVIAAHDELTSSLDFGGVKCSLEFQYMAFEHMSATGVGSSEEIGHLMGAILQKDPDLWADCAERGQELGHTPEVLCLEWLSKDKRFEISAGDRSSWNSRTVVRLKSTWPPPVRGYRAPPVPGSRDQRRSTAPPQQEELQAAQPTAQPSGQPSQQQQQHEEQHQQQATVPPPGSELMASVAAAFPGDSLAAQIMREAAEMVVGKAPQKLALSDKYLLQLCKEHKVGWDRVTKEQRASWRTAIAQHPAWHLQPPARPGADTTWVLVKDQVLSLADDPTAAEAAVAEVMTTQHEMASSLEEIKYITRFKTSVLQYLAAQGEGAWEVSGILTRTILEQDSELWAFCAERGLGQGQNSEDICLGWLSQDPRFEITRAGWADWTEVRLRSTAPPVAAASPDTSPPSSTTESVTLSTPSLFDISALEAAEHHDITQPQHHEGADSAAADKVRGAAAELLSHRPDHTAQFSWLMSELLASGVITDSTSSKRKRGEVARAWLVADPQFQMWEDESGTLQVTLKSSSLVGIEMRMVLQPDGSAQLAPAATEPSTDSLPSVHGENGQSDVAPEADMESFLALLPNRWVTCPCNNLIQLF